MACVTPASGGSPPRATDLPESLGRFRVRRELGRGGMGRVLEAWDPVLRRDVAVKILHEHLRVSTEHLRRFVAEAQLTSQLAHPNIVPVYELGTAPSGEVWFAMKRVEGRSLREVLHDLQMGDPQAVARWTPRRLLGAFVQVAQAVAYAHERGVLHRDLKPENVMLGDFGEVLVTDWGLARCMGVPEAVRATGAGGAIHLSYTLDGAAIGTPGYVSPEQAAGDLDTLNDRSDVWSLGAILYELLTLRRAYPGETGPEILQRSASGPPVEPRARAPERLIAEEVARICLDALSPDPGERPTAARLVVRVERFLEGARRRDQAMVRLGEAEAAWRDFHGARERLARLQVEEAALAQATGPHAPLAEKEALHRGRDAVERGRVDVAAAFGRAITGAERALSHDPGNAEARAFLARAWWLRVEEAEASRDEAQLAFFLDRVREYDDGPYAERLRGDGRLSLATDPPGAEVWMERVRATGLAWGYEPPELLGTTPLVETRLPMGAYRLRLVAPGRRETVYPVRIGRGAHWDGGPEPVRLYSDEELGADVVYVPGGPYETGGDPGASRALPARRVHVGPFAMARFPVTMGAYRAWLDALAAEDPEAALRRAPRRVHTLLDPRADVYLRFDEATRTFHLPESDPEGHRWEDEWPVFAVSWDDARAYAAWKSARDGVTWDLPTEVEWEKAARGADGRVFPWGDRFDPLACKMELSRPGPPSPEAVGAFPLDRSPYGVGDLGGGVREWCADPAFDGDPARRPVRGGGWSCSERLCRAAGRFGFVPASVHTYLGFRLVRRLG